jgi:hypothetical protein
MAKKNLAPNTPKKARRKLSPRYGIAEWYGRDLVAMEPSDRQALGHLAARQDQKEATVDAPICPFLSNLTPGMRCNKSGGVCSIRRFDETGKFVANEAVVTVCPNRFLQTLPSGERVFDWISQIMLDIPKDIIVKETPFLRKIVGESKVAAKDDLEDETKEEIKKAGRIDWILVTPSSVDSLELKWCAVETQALYFSGGKMRSEFDAYAHEASEPIFPKGKRRPDYRSSGPKRLWPQLDVKVPVLRNWGKKVVVLVDRFFFENMNQLSDPFPRAKSDRERRDNADVAWFIVDYDSQMHLTKHKVVFTNLESSRHALNATEPLGMDDFAKTRRDVIKDDRKTNKVFRA